MSAGNGRSTPGAAGPRTPDMVPEQRRAVARDEGKLGPMGGRPSRVPAWDEAVDLGKDPAVVPDPAEVDVPEDLRREIEAHMAKYPDHHSAALPALGAAQRVHGWCSPDAIRQVAAVMRVTPAYLSSVATFYDMLRTEPTGSGYLYVCTSVSCCLRDAKGVYDEIAREAREQGLDDVEVREFECLGACDMAPMASVDGRYVGPLDRSDAREIVSALREGRPVLPGRGLEDEGFRLPWQADAPEPAGGARGAAPRPVDEPPTPPEPHAA